MRVCPESERRGRQPNLSGVSGTNASPFVIMYRKDRVPPMTHMLNAIILISIYPRAVCIVISIDSHAVGGQIC